MKQQVSETLNGVQIENTLSMALQQPFQKRHKFWLILLAYAGAVGCVFSFLTMFSPLYSLPVLLAGMTVIFAFFSWVALKPERSIPPVLGVVLLYCILFFWQKERIANGLMYLTNHVCQAIYMTDWEYFTTDTAYPEFSSVTCVLCFLVFPIVWMICYAVLRYQNFFLSFLITFPFIEIGLFFGIVPNHFFAVLLTAFWFAMAAVQMGSSGINQNAGKTGFLRKKSAFFPVSSMRFMLPERIGIVVLTAVMLLFGGAELLLKQLRYERPELFKDMRSDFQDYVASLHLTDKQILENYGTDQETPQDDLEHIPLGSLEEKIYEDVSVSSISFSENPNTRIYLKYRTGFAYNGSNWTVFPEEAYQNPALENFKALDYYPPEFLYSTVCGTPVEMSMSHANHILAQCIPYGFQKNENVICQLNDAVQTNADHYFIQGNTDYETIFYDAGAVSQVSASELLLNCPPEDTGILASLLNSETSGNVWFSSNHAMALAFQNKNADTAKASEAGILCGTFYDDFVYETYTVLPDTPAMQAVYSAYASELENFNARTATPSELIVKLQELRDKVCDNVTYTLAPGKTPPDIDHTVYFLLENKKGYCEHYATAGTVLARMAGIPARYCEGYMLDCSRNGTLTETQAEDGSISYTSEILDSNAHAWTEIYISGIGWIPFEFTFSYFNSPVPRERPVPETLPKETVPAATAPASPDPAPSETLPIPEQSEISPQLFLIMLSLTIAAFFCILALIFRVVRLSALRKRENHFNQEDRKASALCAYQYLTDLLTECGVHVQGKTIGDLVEESELYCKEFENPAYSLSAAVQIGAKLRYSPHPVTSGELHYLSKTAVSLAEGMYQKASFFKKFYLKWLRHYL